MPGKRVIGVSMYAEPLCGNILGVEWWGKDGHLKRIILRLPEAAVQKIAGRLSRMHQGSFRPFLAGCPGWVWRPEYTAQNSRRANKDDFTLSILTQS